MKPYFFMTAEMYSSTEGSLFPAPNKRHLIWWESDMFTSTVNRNAPINHTGQTNICTNCSWNQFLALNTTMINGWCYNAITKIFEITVVLVEIIQMRWSHETTACFTYTLRKNLNTYMTSAHRQWGCLCWAAGRSQKSWSPSAAGVQSASHKLDLMKETLTTHHTTVAS